MIYYDGRIAKYKNLQVRSDNPCLKQKAIASGANTGKPKVEITNNQVAQCITRKPWKSHTRKSKSYNDQMSFINNRNGFKNSTILMETSNDIDP